MTEQLTFDFNEYGPARALITAQFIFCVASILNLRICPRVYPGYNPRALFKAYPGQIFCGIPEPVSTLRVYPG